VLARYADSDATIAAVTHAGVITLQFQENSGVAGSESRAAGGGPLSAAR
jgi:hypothetical protein